MTTYYTINIYENGNIVDSVTTLYKTFEKAANQADKMIQNAIEQCYTEEEFVPPNRGKMVFHSDYVHYYEFKHVDRMYVIQKMKIEED